MPLKPRTKQVIKALKRYNRTPFVGRTLLSQNLRDSRKVGGRKGATKTILQHFRGK